ncbi:hypothetical protein [Sphingomonas aerolata]|uniref:hypothetical protein n=1 Tax=Sphingomonas aerolata TaxID=185951 RepID=UPI002FE3EBCA
MKKHFIAALMSIAVVAPGMVPVEAVAQRHDDRRGHDDRRNNDLAPRQRPQLAR